MSLAPLYGHPEPRALLGRAVATGTLAQSVLLHGPPGVGKERLALWLAQLVVCESPAEGPEPCGRCLPCRLTLRLEHPDVHWFFPLPRPEGGADKIRERLEEHRAAELQSRRENRLHLPSYEKAPAHFLASIQTLQQLASVRPSMGRRRVFVVGDAELMVPQESSPEAANAFLKLLEEPPDGTTLVLTSSQPGALLPTIRSRVLPLRVAPLPDGTVRDFLVAEAGMGEAQAEELAAQANGAIGRALRLAPSGTGSLARQREKAWQLLLAALSNTPLLRLGLGHEQAAFGARGDYMGELEALGSWLRDLLAVASGAADAVPDRKARQLLEAALAQGAVTPQGVAAALDRVAEAQEMAMGNVNPQLVTAVLLRGIQADLGRGGTARRASALPHR